MSEERHAGRERLAGTGRAAQGPGLHAVGLAGARVAAPIIKKGGGGLLVRLKTQWAAVAGPPWDRRAWPQALGRGGVLKLRVAPEAALELQHEAPIVIERINLFLGRPAVSRLALVQGPLPAAALPRAAPPAPSLRETAAIAELLAGIDDPQLRAALLRLGQAVAAARR